MIKKLILAKALLVKPIYEMRMDWNSNCKFRAIYFPFTFEGNFYYVFTKAFIKRKYPRRYDPTDIYRDEAKRIYERVRKCPEKYLFD